MLVVRSMFSRCFLENRTTRTVATLWNYCTTTLWYTPVLPTLLISLAWNTDLLVHFAKYDELQFTHMVGEFLKHQRWQHCGVLSSNKLWCCRKYASLQFYHLSSSFIFLQDDEMMVWPQFAHTHTHYTTNYEILRGIYSLSTTTLNIIPNFKDFIRAQCGKVPSFKSQSLIFNVAFIPNWFYVKSKWERNSFALLTDISNNKFFYVTIRRVTMYCILNIMTKIDSRLFGMIFGVLLYRAFSCASC